MLSAPPVVQGRFRNVINICITAAAMLLGTTGALAQSPTPRAVTPTADGVLMRCGPGAAWYPVATLKPGMVLRADTEVEGWLRVDYLPGMNVVVKADEGDLKEAEGKVVLSRRSRLRALSSADPVFDESYKAVFEGFLAPGTEMRYVGTIKNRAGENAGYIVAAPAGAKAYISAREVRDAKPEEAAAPVKAVEQPKALSTPPAGTPAQPVTQPTAAPTTTSLPVSADPTAQSTTPPAGDSTPAPTPTTPVETAPLEPPPPPQAKGPTIRQLDRAYDELMAKPLAEADPQELIEQYNQYADNLTGEPGSGRTVKYVDTRVQLLKIRQRAREMLPEIQSLEDATKNAADKYRLTIDRLIANREYKVVGRLYPSTVYDGTRLPRMYRLISIDPGVKTTLAYVIPVPDHQLEQKVGSIVGILGDGTIEPSAMVEIITPTVVDVLRSAAELPPE